MEEYREIVLLETNLRVYRNGDIWRLSKGGRGGKKGKWKLVTLTPNTKGYFIIELKNKMYQYHRIVGYAYLGLDINNPKEMIDHINHITNDNRVENLRISDNQKNQFNRDVKGYYFRKDVNKWYAKISVNGKDKHLGGFKTEEEAQQAYLNSKLIYHII